MSLHILLLGSSVRDHGGHPRLFQVVTLCPTFRNELHPLLMVISLRLVGPQTGPGGVGPGAWEERDRLGTLQDNQVRLESEPFSVRRAARPDNRVQAPQGGEGSSGGGGLAHRHHQGAEGILVGRVEPSRVAMRNKMIWVFEDSET